MLKELVIKNRSVRRYDNGEKVSREVLRELVDSVRYCSNTGNRQRIRYITVTDEVLCAQIREELGFAAYLKDWAGPAEDECPTGYIVMLSEDDDRNLYIDLGIAAGTLTLLARERGLGCCLFRSFDEKKLSKLLELRGYEPKLVLSLGIPDEKIELEAAKDGDIKYYRREDGTHVVPKLSLSEILLEQK